MKGRWKEGEREGRGVREGQGIAGQRGEEEERIRQRLTLEWLGMQDAGPERVAVSFGSSTGS